MIPKLHYFNPGHETAVLSYSRHYTPSITVQKMMRDLAYLPYWYADPGDYVLVKEITADPNSFPEEFKRDIEIVTPQLLKVEKESLRELQAVPWGISPHILQFYTQLRNRYHLPVCIPEWEEQYHSLTSRQTAALCLEKIKRKLPSVSLPAVPVFFSDPDELEKLVKSKENCIIKTPFSSSGRGLLWLEGNKLGKKDKEWIKGAIQKQSMVSVEDKLPRLQDYGWEFYLDNEGKVNYLGIVPFSTNEKGIYKGSSLENSERVEHSIKALLGEDIYQQTLKALTESIQELYGGHYCGYLGVDMMLYQTPEKTVAIHPCVEINMRCTMGLVALKLQRLLQPESKGYFFISYDRTPPECFNHHLHMQETYPLYIEDKTIRKGYFSLCPILPDTQYRAYIMVF